MIRIRYNNKLNTKPKVFKFYTHWELLIGVVLAMLPIAFAAVFQGDVKPGDVVIIFVVYTLFLVYFKIGKPEGYFGHLIKKYLTPDRYRPGFKCVEYPICNNLETYIKEVGDSKDPEFNKRMLIELQKRLVRAGVIPLTKYSTFLYLDIEKEESDSVIKEALRVLDKGKVLVWDEEEY